MWCECAHYLFIRLEWRICDNRRIGRSSHRCWFAKLSRHIEVTSSQFHFDNNNNSYPHLSPTHYTNNSVHNFAKFAYKMHGLVANGLAMIIGPISSNCCRIVFSAQIAINVVVWCAYLYSVIKVIRMHVVRMESLWCETSQWHQMVWRAHRSRCGWFDADFGIESNISNIDFYLFYSFLVDSSWAYWILYQHRHIRSSVVRSI